MPDKDRILVFTTSALIGNPYVLTDEKLYPNAHIVVSTATLGKLDRFGKEQGGTTERAFRSRMVAEAIAKLHHSGHFLKENDHPVYTGCKTFELLDADRKNQHENLDADGYNESSHGRFALMVALDVKKAHPEAEVTLVVDKDYDSVIPIRAHRCGLKFEYVLPMPYVGYTGFTKIWVSDKVFASICGLTEHTKMAMSYVLAWNEEMGGYTKTDGLKANQYLQVLNGSSQRIVRVVKQGNGFSVVGTACDSWKPLGVAPKSSTQKMLLDALHLSPKDKERYVIGLGPGGCGKTYLALAAAMELQDKKIVKNIVYVRVLKESDETMGYLPGNPDEKGDPYYQPLYQNLQKLVGSDDVDYIMKMYNIKAMPVNFVRGITFDDTFVIFDEAQNANVEQMKSVSSRLGENSSLVVLGDISQIDAYGTSSTMNQFGNGLVHALNTMKGEEPVFVVGLDTVDIVRSKISRLVAEKQ
ncbi:MAG: PhoH family protein [Candidatus Nomurabacteria bacterium]|jgi:predicted ribonuclease YlaK|nr:PhoH family protein [Candidatus Nomurabacteria bacterium]